MIRSEDAAFDFARRSRRPPKDPVNAVLSFLYSMLIKQCLVSDVSVGFDPYMGFYHQPKYGKPALALDLAEELRPIVAYDVHAAPRRTVQNPRGDDVHCQPDAADY